MSFTGGSSCPLAGSGTTAHCTASYAPTNTGARTITASYSGDATHTASTARTTVRVMLPNNRFAISNVRTTPTGRVSFQLKPPGPGIADVLETAWLDNFARTAALLQPAPRRFVFARKHLQVSRAGIISVTVLPNQRGKTLIKHHRYAILIRLWVSYTPTGGTQRNIGLYGVRITHPKRRRRTR